MNRIKSAAGQFSTLLYAGLIAAAGAQAVRADEIRIKMLDTSDSGPLAFEPSFVQAQTGDTIAFEPTKKGGHSAVSLLVPPGAQAWSGAPGKEMRVKLDADGVTSMRAQRTK